MKTIYLALSVLLSAISFAGCTTNDGPNHAIYGMWKVEHIYIDNEPDASYEGNLFIMFQNDVIRTVGLISSYGMWQESGNYAQITVWFEIEGQKPDMSAHFACNEPNICKVITLNNKSFIFEMTNPVSSAIYRYQMVKWN